MPWKFVIEGNPASKKNSRVIFKNRAGIPFIGKSAKLKDTEQAGIWQLVSQKNKQQLETIRKPISVRITFYVQDRRRRDLVNILQLPCDLLQAAGIIKDDSLIHSVDGSRILLDKERPRTEIEISHFEP